MAFQFGLPKACRPLKMPVRIWGRDASGQPFLQEAITEAVGPNQARIAGLRCTVKVDEVLGLSCEGRKGRFRVIEVATAGSAIAGQIVVSPLDTLQNFWGLDFSKPQVDPSERRAAPRYRCQGAVSIWQQDPQNPIHAGVSDISLSGCYIDLMFPLPIGTTISMTLNISEALVRTTGKVATSHPAIGMGVQFAAMSDADRETLRQIIARLLAASEA